jgi:hypothetical protein
MMKYSPDAFLECHPEETTSKDQIYTEEDDSRRLGLYGIEENKIHTLPGRVRVPPSA